MIYEIRNSMYKLWSTTRRKLSMSRITHFSSYNRIKIYIDEILHISIPKDLNTKIQAWHESENTYIIEIRAADNTQIYEYENIEIWKEILNNLDKTI